MQPRTAHGEPRAYFDQQMQIVTDDCQLWLYNTDTNGYGILRVGPHHRKVHRLSCEAIHGPPVGNKNEAAHGLQHPCIARSCFNRFHLSWKTRQENSDDRRRDQTMLTGEKHPGARFTDLQVQEIRQRYLSGEKRMALASEYDVVYNTIDLIVRHLSWKHLD